MTDKEFKRLNRAQLIDIIYQLQLQIEQLNEEKLGLENELAEKRLRLSNVGNIAEAALEINNCFRSAQSAAEQYLNEIKAIRVETEAKRQQILADAQAEAKAIITNAKMIQSNCDFAIKTSLNEFKQNRSDNG